MLYGKSDTLLLFAFQSFFPFHWILRSCWQFTLWTFIQHRRLGYLRRFASCCCFESIWCCPQCITWRCCSETDKLLLFESSRWSQAGGFGNDLGLDFLDRLPQWDEKERGHRSLFFEIVDLFVNINEQSVDSLDLEFAGYQSLLKVQVLLLQEFEIEDSLM